MKPFHSFYQTINRIENGLVDIGKDFGLAHQFVDICGLVVNMILVLMGCFAIGFLVKIIIQNMKVTRHIVDSTYR